MIELKTTYDDPWGDVFCAALESVLVNGKRPGDISGATSIRAGLGLVLGCIEQTTTFTEAEAWEYLDAPNRTTVRMLSEMERYAPRIRNWQQSQLRK